MIIEWSSSDEEVIQSLHPLPSSYGTGGCSTMNEDQHFEKRRDSIQSFLDHSLFSGVKKRCIHLQKPDEEKSLSSKCCNEEKKHNCQGSQNSLPSLKHHDLSVLENGVDIGKCESLLPINGKCDRVLSCTNTGDINILEPQSPVLGLGRIWDKSCSPILRARKAQLKTSFDVIKKKLTFSNAMSVKRQISIDDDVSVKLESSGTAIARKEEKKNLNSYNEHSFHSNITMKDFNVHHTKFDECMFHSNSVQTRKTVSPEKNHCSLITLKDFRGEYTPSDCIDQAIQLGSHGSQDDLKTLDVNLKPFLSLSEEHLELDIGECTSESIAGTMKGTDERLDHNTKTSMNDVDISEVSFL